MMCIDDIQHMQNTMHHLYLDDLSRNHGAKGTPVWRGVVVLAEKSIWYTVGK